MKKYSKYKKTNLDFIGEIPKSWDIIKLKFIGDSTIGITYSPKDVSDNTNGKLVLRASNIQNSKLSFKDNVYVDKEYTDKYKIKKNDILICSRSGSKSLIGKNIIIKDKEIEGSYFGAFMTVYRSPENKYIQKVLSSKLFDHQIELFSTTTINQLTIGTLNNIYIPFPTEKKERESIASYLDHKTSLIDKLITNNEKKIELLEEKRKATINQAVTCGLDADGNLRQRPSKDAKPNEASGVVWKDSGVEWIGEIPMHWEVKKLKYEFKYEKGKNAQLYTKEYFANHIGIFPVYSGQTANLGVMGLINNFDYEIKEALLVTTVGAKAMTVRDIEGKFSLSQNCALITSKSENTKIAYFKYYLPPLFDFEKKLLSQIMQPSLRFDDLDNYKIVLPPREEQTAIATYLDQETTKIDELVEKIKIQNTLLKEYRQSLISHVVTGKVDVRDEVKLLETKNV